MAILLVLSLCLLFGCTTSTSVPEVSEVEPTEQIVEEEPTEVVTSSSAPPNQPDTTADVLSVKFSGAENAYQFSVEISSPDTGCEQYADWWEVVAEDGTLIYRRILAHSHRDEQPFVRSGGPVNISEGTVVIIRAHMYPTGYGGIAMKGSIGLGFDSTDIPADFAAHTESENPLPDGCAF